MAARPESGIRRQGGILMMAGAAVVLASLPLPEITASRDGVSRSLSGMHGVALWLLIICIFAFLRGYSAVKPAGFRTSLPIISGLVVTWAIYTRWQDIDSAIKSAAGIAGLIVSPGIGFWLTCIGGALIVVGSLILQFVQPQRV
jgi:hypothetical protein